MSEFIANARDPIEHLFNDHTWCDSAWCWAKEVSDKIGKVMKAVSNKCVDIFSSGLVQSKDTDAETQTVNPHQQVDPIVLNKIILDTSNSHSEFTCSEDSDVTENMDMEGEYEGTKNDEKKECDYFTTYLDNYLVDKDIFSVEEMKFLKEREKGIDQKNDMSYYQCKEKHQQLYHDLTAVCSPLIPRKMMTMLHHNYDTHKKRSDE